MKTKKELNALKKEVEDLSKKLTELTDDELEEVRAGFIGTPARDFFPILVGSAVAHIVPGLPDAEKQIASDPSRFE